MNDQDKLKILDYAYDYLAGSLWWGSEPFIQKSFNSWHPSKTGKKRKCHPLLSCREERVKALAEPIVMLAGTSLKRQEDERDNLVVLMNESCPGRKTSFSLETETELIIANDFLYHVENDNETENIYDSPETPLWERRRLWPN